ncbi:MAG: hypothetical protein HY908_32915 [Myxococcales bacterium]|nr:hypothetical protein [Myxococcales bacterium]
MKSLVTWSMMSLCSAMLALSGCEPVFVAGDSDTDIAMLKDATYLKLAINRNKTEIMCNAYSNASGKWLVQPMCIFPKDPKSTPYPCSTATDPAGNLIVDEQGNPMADQTE